MTQTRVKNSSTLRAFDVLDVLIKHPTGLSISKLANKMHLQRTATYRTCEDLVTAGMVIKIGSPAIYKISAQALRFGAAFSPNTSLAHKTHTALQTAADQTGQMIHLGQLEGAQVVIMDHADMHGAPPDTITRGTAFPAHCSANGRAILAFNTRDLAAQVLRGGLSQETPYTITDETDFLSELNNIQDNGYAIDIQQVFENRISLSVPIVAKDHQVTSSLSITLNATSGSVDQLVDQLEFLQDTAKELALLKQQF